MTDVVKECLSWEAEFNLDLEVCIRIQFNKQSLRVACGVRGKDRKGRSFQVEGSAHAKEWQPAVICRDQGATKNSDSA